MENAKLTCWECKKRREILELRAQGQIAIQVIFNHCAGCLRNPINQVEEGQILSALFGASIGELKDNWEEDSCQKSLSKN